MSGFMESELSITLQLQCGLQQKIIHPFCLVDTDFSILLQFKTGILHKKNNNTPSALVDVTVITSEF